MVVSSRAIVRICGGCLACGVAMLLIGRYFGISAMSGTGILLASSAYVATAFAAPALQSPYGVLVLLALLCCFVSDMIGPSNFEAGVWGFLAAHFFLVGATTQVPKRLRDGIVGAAFLVPAAALFTLALLPNMPNQERPVILAYTATIAVMAILATSARQASGLLCAGAVIFFVSDIFVGLWRYTDNRIFGFVCYPLYYFSCYLLALSIQNRVVAIAQHRARNSATTLDGA